MRHPHVLQLIVDSLRYWVTEMHVDGFRFDLAASLARQFHEVDRLSAFFDLIQLDPVISQVKLIAEPWDVGEGGYQVGNFPTLWSEWNGRYRDTVRDYWRGADRHARPSSATASPAAPTSTGRDGRRPYASINFVTAHDGFTLTDLVSYNDKHNEANGEGNRDGDDHNRSWNSGAEGPTDDPEIVGAASAGRSATCWRRCCCPRACPCCWRRRARPHPAWQQQRLLPGQRPLLAGAGTTSTATSSEFAHELIALAPTTRSSAAAGSSRAARARSARSPTSPGCRPDGTEMSDEDWDVGFARSSPCSSTAAPSPIPTRSANGSTTTRSSSSSTPRRQPGHRSPPPQRAGLPAWVTLRRHRQPPTAPCAVTVGESGRSTSPRQPCSSSNAPMTPRSMS